MCLFWQSFCDKCGLHPSCLPHTHAHTHTHPHAHTHTFNSPLSGTTWASWYQKGKTNLDFTEARNSEWQWLQLSHMQVNTLLQTDNDTNTQPLSFLHIGCPSCCPTNSIKALKALFLHLFWNRIIGERCHSGIQRGVGAAIPRPSSGADGHCASLGALPLAILRRLGASPPAMLIVRKQR